MRNLFWANESSYNIDPTYDDIHVTILEDSEINNPGNHAWMARNGERLHLTFRSTTDTGKVVHWFYHSDTGTWRQHKYNNGCPNPATGDTSALKQKATDLLSPSLLDFLVASKPKKKRGQKPTSNPQVTVPVLAVPTAPSTLSVPQVSVPTVPVVTVPTAPSTPSVSSVRPSQNLPWKWDEDYGMAPRVVAPPPMTSSMLNVLYPGQNFGIWGV